MASPRAVRLAAAVLGAIAALGPLPAGAHVPGSAPVGSSATVVLGPATGGGNPSELHVLVGPGGLDLPVQPGDTLAYNWSINDGLGPDVDFSVHDHVNGTTTYVEYHGRALNGSWVVVSNVTLMVSFKNPTAYNLTLVFNFTLFAPPVQFSPLFFILPATLGIAVGWFLWVRAGRPAEEGGIDEAYPTDPRAGRRKRGGEEE